MRLSSSSSDEEVEVELLDSVSKIDEQLSSMVLAKSGHVNRPSGNQIDEKEPPTSREELQRTNEELRCEVADLTSALLARDLELVRLRERCQSLTTAVEQQDAVIAEIYAAANETIRESVVTTLPIDTTGRSLSKVSVEVTTGKCSYIQRKEEKRTWMSSMKRYPGAVGMVEPAPKTSEARSMSSHGEKVVKSLTETVSNEVKKPKKGDERLQLPCSPRTSMNSNLLHASASAHSSSSTATASSSSSLFGDVGDPISKPLPSWTSPRNGSVSQRRPSFERHNSSPTEEIIARSAGFLRKSNRTMSGRLSVSDLGLLHNDDDGDGENQLHESSPLSGSMRQENYSSDLKDLYDDREPEVSTRSRSQRNLFADVDEALQTKSKQCDADPEDGDGDSLTYGEFLQRISLPASRDILDQIRMFVGSILGPRGDGRPPRSTDYVEYDFYGTHEFRRRCNRFFESMGDILLRHPVWRHASETRLAKARDGIEKYVMDKVSDIALNQLKECHEWAKEDEALLRRMRLLSFITPAMLDIKPCMRNEVVWSMAEDELRRINSFRSPGDKINCIVRCCGVIFSVLNLSRGDSGSRPGADDFLPVFIYIVLHSQIPRLHSNCEYISAYRNQADLMSKAGYCFVNLRSAIEFIMVMDGSMLSIPEDEFQRLYSEREKILLKP